MDEPLSSNATTVEVEQAEPRQPTEMGQAGVVHRRAFLEIEAFEGLKTPEVLQNGVVDSPPIFQADGSHSGEIIRAKGPIQPSRPRRLGAVGVGGEPDPRLPVVADFPPDPLDRRDRLALDAGTMCEPAQPTAKDKHERHQDPQAQAQTPPMPR